MQPMAAGPKPSSTTTYSHNTKAVRSDVENGCPWRKLWTLTRSDVFMWCRL